MRKLVFLTMLLAFSLALGQIGPLCAELMNPPVLGHYYYPYVSITVKVDSACSGNPTGTKYQFRRIHQSFGGSDSTTVFIEADTCKFLNANDGERYWYRVRATFGADTSDWSAPIDITHDTKPPNVVPYFIALYCGDPPQRVELIWERAEDNASAIHMYKIYRFTDPRKVSVIDNITLAIDSVFEDGSILYFYTDESIELRKRYYYVVVPFDSAGLPPGPLGYHPRTGNPWHEVVTSGPGECGMPMCAILEPIPNVITTDFYTVKSSKHCYPRPEMQYQYRLIDVAEGDTFLSAWRDQPHHDWPMEDCHRYIFGIRARSTYPDTILEWYNKREIVISDIYGPLRGADSIVANPNDDGDIVIRFWTSFEDEIDCGTGLGEIRLYRLLADEFDTLEDEAILDTTRSYIKVFNIEEYKDTGYYYWWDMGEFIEDGKEYYYYLLFFDHIGHYIFGGGTRTKSDKSVAPPILIDLPRWSEGDSVVLSIIDTSHCDITRLMIEQSRRSGFTDEVVSYVFSSIHDAALSNPDDYDCTDWDTLTCVVHGISEGPYFFRVWVWDNINNEAVSNYVVTHFDQTPPRAVMANDLKSIAECTNELLISVTFPGSFDDGIGVESYNIYRSSIEGNIGDLVASISHSGAPSYEFIDDDPDPADNFRANYYSIVVADSFGNLSEDLSEPRQKGFAPHTPPYPVEIDTVYMDIAYDSKIWIVVEWTDITPSGYGPPGWSDFNKYRVEHTAAAEWLCTGDSLLVWREKPIRRDTIRLPDTIIVGAPFRFFHIATIDQYGNESAYSQWIEFEDTLFRGKSDTIHFYRGWNLISLPLIPSSMRLDEIFPYIPLGNCFKYNTATRMYENAYDLEVGVGYWILSIVDHYQTIDGYSIPSLSLRLTGSGWHIIGGLSKRDPACNAVFTVNPLEAFYPRTNVLGYHPDSGFVSTEELQPGKGYFMLLSADATVNIRYSGSMKSFVNFPIDASLVFGCQKLKFAIDGYDVIMPPLPTTTYPSYIVGDEDEMLLKGLSYSGNWTVEVPEETNLTVQSLLDGRWEISGMGIHYELNEGDVYPLQAGKYEVSYDPKPLVFNINSYPNPFNAQVNIAITVPSKDMITVSIRDIRGKTVRELYNDIVQPGILNLMWDGKDNSDRALPSGVYIVDASGQKFSSVSNVILIR